MTAKPSLTIFPAPDAGGAILAAQIQELGHAKGFQCRIEHEFTVRTGMRAQLCDDVVVYDLTPTAVSKALTAGCRASTSTSRTSCW